MKRPHLFNAETDYGVLVGWWNDRKQPVSRTDELPPVGFINDEAACFLVQTDAGIAFLDNLIASSAPSPTRSASIDAVVSACIEVARVSGFRSVAALTEMDSVYERAIQPHGFKWVSVFHLLIRSLK